MEPVFSALQAEQSVEHLMKSVNFFCVFVHINYVLLTCNIMVNVCLQEVHGITEMLAETLYENGQYVELMLHDIMLCYAMLRLHHFPLHCVDYIIADAEPRLIF